MYQNVISFKFILIQHSAFIFKSSMASHNLNIKFISFNVVCCSSQITQPFSFYTRKYKSNILAFLKKKNWNSTKLSHLFVPMIKSLSFPGMIYLALTLPSQLICSLKLNLELFPNKLTQTREVAQWLQVVAALQRTCIQFPASTWQLTTIVILAPRNLYNLF